jgi:hypothetical protein
MSVSCTRTGNFAGSSIVLHPEWLPDMGFTPGALVQVLPEAGGLFLILCHEKIQKYSDLLQVAEEKNGTLITVGCSGNVIWLEIEVHYIRNAGLDIDDPLYVRYEYGLIRIRKLSEYLEMPAMSAICF